MCHLLLALPFVALPVLWLLPLGAALPLYGAALVLTAGVYVLAVKAMRRPVCAGAESLLHAIGTVRSADGGSIGVWVKSELWSAETDDEPLAVGDSVEVLAIDGLKLQVRKLASADGTSGPAAGSRCVFHLE